MPETASSGIIAAFPTTSVYLFRVFVLSRFCQTGTVFLCKNPMDMIVVVSPILLSSGICFMKININFAQSDKDLRERLITDRTLPERVRRKMPV